MVKTTAYIVNSPRLKLSDRIKECVYDRCSRRFWPKNARHKFCSIRCRDLEHNATHAPRFQREELNNIPQLTDAEFELVYDLTHELPMTEGDRKRAERLIERQKRLVREAGRVIKTPCDSEEPPAVHNLRVYRRGSDGIYSQE